MKCIVKLPTESFLKTNGEDPGISSVSNLKSITMYSKDRILNMSNSTGMLTKNLQVVSFDADWREIYLGNFSNEYLKCQKNSSKYCSITTVRSVSFTILNEFIKVF